MLKNKTTGNILAENVKFCNSVFSKALGLMFSSKDEDTALVFVFDKPKKIDLHMFFVFYPIDVLFLDKDKKIVEIKRNFKPFSYYKATNKAKYVVEISKLNQEYKEKDKISF